MAHRAHRRVLTGAEANARRPLKTSQRLGPVGWVFAVLAAAWAAVELWPITQFSAFDSVSGDAMLVVRTLGDVAIVALPTGLLLGFPGARRRNPWLFRGVVLLALVQLLQPAIRALQGWVFEQVDPGVEGFSPLYAALTMLSLAVGVISLAAVWAVSDGLFDAGARPHRAFLFVVGGAAVVLDLALIVPYVAANGLGIFTNGVLDLVSLALSLAMAVLWYVVVARLVVGFAAGLVPRRAWALGAIAGAMFILELLASTFLLWAGQAGRVAVDLAPLLLVAASAVWILLFAAFANGLGRGPSRRAGGRRRIPGYELGRRAGPAAEGIPT
jgi:hypothetical protein